MNVKLVFVGGRNNGRTMYFTTQESLDAALKNLVRARFMTLKSIGLDQNDDGSQSCFVMVGEKKVIFANVSYDESGKADANW